MTVDDSRNGGGCGHIYYVIRLEGGELYKIRGTIWVSCRAFIVYITTFLDGPYYREQGMHKGTAARMACLANVQPRSSSAVLFSRYIFHCMTCYLGKKQKVFV